MIGNRFNTVKKTVVTHSELQ